LTTYRFPSIFVTYFTPESRTQHHSTKHNLQDKQKILYYFFETVIIISFAAVIVTIFISINQSISQ